MKSIAEWINEQGGPDAAQKAVQKQYRKAPGPKPEIKAFHALQSMGLFRGDVGWLDFQKAGGMSALNEESQHAFQWVMGHTGVQPSAWIESAPAGLPRAMQAGAGFLNYQAKLMYKSLFERRYKRPMSETEWHNLLVQNVPYRDVYLLAGMNPKAANLFGKMSDLFAPDLPNLLVGEAAGIVARPVVNAIRGSRFAKGVIARLGEALTKGKPATEAATTLRGVAEAANQAAEHEGATLEELNRQMGQSVQARTRRINAPQEQPKVQAGGLEATAPKPPASGTPKGRRGAQAKTPEPTLSPISGITEKPKRLRVQKPQEALELGTKPAYPKETLKKAPAAPVMTEEEKAIDTIHRTNFSEAEKAKRIQAIRQGTAEGQQYIEQAKEVRKRGHIGAGVAKKMARQQEEALTRPLPEDVGERTPHPAEVSEAPQALPAPTGEVVPKAVIPSEEIGLRAKLGYLQASLPRGWQKRQNEPAIQKMLQDIEAQKQKIQAFLAQKSERMPEAVAPQTPPAGAPQQDVQGATGGTVKASVSPERKAIRVWEYQSKKLQQPLLLQGNDVGFRPNKVQTPEAYSQRLDAVWQSHYIAPEKIPELKAQYQRFYDAWQTHQARKPTTPTPTPPATVPMEGAQRPFQGFPEEGTSPEAKPAALPKSEDPYSNWSQSDWASVQRQAQGKGPQAEAAKRLLRDAGQMGPESGAVSTAPLKAGAQLLQKGIEGIDYLSTTARDIDEMAKRNAGVRQMMDIKGLRYLTHSLANVIGVERAMKVTGSLVHVPVRFWGSFLNYMQLFGRGPAQTWENLAESALLAAKHGPDYENLMRLGAESRNPQWMNLLRTQMETEVPLKGLPKAATTPEESATVMERLAETPETPKPAYQPGRFQKVMRITGYPLEQTNALFQVTTLRTQLKEMAAYAENAADRDLANRFLKGEAVPFAAFSKAAQAELHHGIESTWYNSAMLPDSVRFLSRMGVGPLFNFAAAMSVKIPYTIARKAAAGDVRPLVQTILLKMREAWSQKPPIGTEGTTANQLQPGAGRLPGFGTPGPAWLPKFLKPPEQRFEPQYDEGGRTIGRQRFIPLTNEPEEGSDVTGNLASLWDWRNMPVVQLGQNIADVVKAGASLLSPVSVEDKSGKSQTVYPEAKPAIGEALKNLAYQFGPSEAAILMKTPQDVGPFQDFRRAAGMGKPVPTSQGMVPSQSPVDLLAPLLGMRSQPGDKATIQYQLSFEHKRLNQEMGQMLRRTQDPAVQQAIQKQYLRKHLELDTRAGLLDPATLRHAMGQIR